MSTTEVTIASEPFPRCLTHIRVSAGESTIPRISEMATFIVDSGASRLQTYMTRAELVDLILALQLAHDELDEQMTPAHVIAELAE